MGVDIFKQALDLVSLNLPDINYKIDEPMKLHTSFKIGGAVRAMFFPSSEDELLGLMGLFTISEINPFILGNGTNLLVSDNPLNMIVINTSGLNDVRVSSDSEITAGAGITLTRLALFAYENSLAGLEFAHGIPGSFGGAIYMNAGAYGGEMKDVVITTRALAVDGMIHEIKGEAHEFGYRQSVFSGEDDTILSGVVKLEKANKDEIKEKMDELKRRRTTSQPLDLPSAGSIFKRPKDGYVGALVEEAGLKGYSIGGAQVSPKHAGFIVNTGGATYDDVRRLIEYIQETILDKFSVELKTEIKMIS